MLFDANYESMVLLECKIEALFDVEY